MYELPMKDGEVKIGDVIVDLMMAGPIEGYGIIEALIAHAEAEERGRIIKLFGEMKTKPVTNSWQADCNSITDRHIDAIRNMDKE